MKNKLKNALAIVYRPPTENLKWLFVNLLSAIVLIGMGTIEISAQINVPCSPNNPVTVIGDVSDVSCFGYANGEIDLSVSGGIPPYSYSWSNGETSEDLSGLSPGIYSVDVYDNWQCHGSAWFVIGQPSELNLEIALTEQACGQPSGCAIMSGGTQPYNLFVFTCGFVDPTTDPIPDIAVDVDGTVDISNSSDYAPATDVLFDPNSTDPNMRCANDIPDGLYLVVLDDANGCFDYELVHIQGNGGIEITATVTEPLCYGGANGSIDVEISGGSAPYSCHWAMSAIDPNGTTNEIDPILVNNCDLNNISAGTYLLFVEDANGCSTTQTFHVGQNDQVNLELELTYPVCGGQPDGCAYFSGGTGEYQVYAFEAPIVFPTPVEPEILIDGSGNVIAVDVNGSTDFAETTDILPISYPWITDSVICADDLPNGHWLIVLIDSNGCYDYEWLHVQGTSGLTVNGIVAEPLCYGDANGSIDVEIEGGTAPYSCFWAIPVDQNSTDPTGDVLPIDPTNLNNCSLDNVSAGVYFLFVEDANGCTVTHTFHVGQNDPVNVDIELYQQDCGGQPDGCAFFSGGTGEYHIYIYEGPIVDPVPVEPEILVDGSGNVTVTDLSASTDIALPEPFPWYTDSMLCAEDLPNGHFLIIIVDSNGCYDYEWFHVQGTPGMTVSGTITEPLCYGDANGSIDVMIEGGTAPYFCAWAIPVDGSSIDPNGDVLPIDPISVNNCSLDNITTGVYFLMVEDANGCTATQTFVVEQNDQVDVEVVLTYPVCGGQPNACVFMSGGTEEYHLYVFEGGIPVPTEPVIEVDSNGDVTIADMAINTDILPIPNPWITDSVLCANGVDDGYYLVVLVDSNGCFDYEWVEVQGTSGLSINLTFDQYGAYACVNPEGGSAPYFINWTDMIGNIQFPAISQECVYELPEGMYSVTVIDANGCEATDWFIIDPQQCSAGFAEVIPSEIWSGMGTTFQLTGHSAASIQWQFRTEFTPWLDVPNGTTALFNTPPIYVASNKEIEVRAMVICEDGEVLISNVAVLTVYVLEQYMLAAPPDSELFGTQLTGINSVDPIIDLQVYPSPTTGQVYLVSPTDQSNVQISVTDLNGRTLRVDRLDESRIGAKYEIDLAGNTPGIYLINYRSDQGSKTTRVVLK